MNTAGPTQDERNGALITYILLAWLAWMALHITTLIGFVIIHIVASVIHGLYFLHSILWLVQLIFGIIAALAASKGESYRFPFALRLVK